MNRSTSIQPAKIIVCGSALLFLLLCLVSTANSVEALVPISTLTLLWMICWYLYRQRTLDRDAWSWGWLPFSSGLLLLSFILLPLSFSYTRSNYSHLWLTFGLCWLIYLFLINEKPNIWWIITPLLLIQGSVALLQFITGGDLGLQLLGELQLNATSGRSATIMVRGQRFLRAHGLTAHPDQLALIILFALFALIPIWPTLYSWRKAITSFAIIMGFAGLFFAFSQAAFIALLVASCVYAASYLIHRRRQQRPFTGQHVAVGGGLVIGLLSIFLLLNNTLFDFRQAYAPSTTNISSGRNARIALDLYRDNPITGIGPHNYPLAKSPTLASNAAQSQILIVAAQFGFFAVIAWVFILFLPLLRSGSFGRYTPQTAIWSIFLTYSLLQPLPLPWTNLMSAAICALIFYTATVSLAEQ